MATSMKQWAHSLICRAEKESEFRCFADEKKKLGDEMVKVSAQVPDLSLVRNF